ncbi:unnamed protein product [Trichobilharzia szidati]|nr:unnamed protein product [Trichobilharzia szidati]
MPSFVTSYPTDDKKSWDKFAVTAAAYVYKSVGESVSQPLRVWLSNSASAAILHGLLGELTTSTEAGRGCEDSRSPEEATTQNMSIADACLHNRQDGHWCYGRWTVDNVASSSEMKDVLNCEMANACVSVMIAAVINYFQENRYIPTGLMKDNYASRILESGVMEKYGVKDESDKMKAMLITGRWVSKLIVFRKATKHRQLVHPIRPVKRIGYKQSLRKLDISKHLFDVPAGFTDTRIAYMIADRMVRSVCIPFFKRFHELIELRKQYCRIISDPFHYHIHGDYLTGSPRTTIIDTSKNLFGRLITYLRVFEPESELLLYSRGCEKHYLDYSDRWEDILRDIHDEIYMPSGNNLTEVLREAGNIPDEFPPNGEEMKACWKEYGVGEKIQQSILKYYLTSSQS